MELVKPPAQPENDDTKAAPQVNDVAAPSAPPMPQSDAQPPAVTPPAPNDQEVAPAPATTDDDTTQPADADAEEAPQPKPTRPPKVPKQRGSGFAIFAAIVIVLALGAMFTYAYLRSNNISLF